MTERLIKKYPNRRLYDTTESAYITIDRVREMVIQKIPFRVIDKKTNDDITRQILLQIIMEQENGDGEPMFSTDVLINFIRNYGESTQQTFSQYMEQSLKFFAQQQEMLADQIAKPLKNTPGELWVEMGKQQMDAWQDMQKQLFEVLVSSGKK